MRRALFLFLLRIFHLSPSSRDIDKKGLIIILIDGLSHTTLRLAMEEKYCSFFSRLLKNGYTLSNYYCGPPATTTATEAELFFGSSENIPGFSWFDRSLMKGIRGNRAETIELYENSLKSKSALLNGGSCIGGVFSSQATQYSLSGKDLQLKRPFRILHILFYVFFIFLNPLRFSLTLYLILKSLLTSFFLLVKKHSKKRFFALLKESFSRIFLGNMLTYMAELEILRETPILFIDYLLYDEFAHEYGAKSKTTLSSLRLIDWYCKSLYNLSKKTKRKYDVVFLSDHGQTSSIPYPDLSHGSLEAMVQNALQDKSRSIIKTFLNFDVNSNKSLYLVPGGSAIHLYFSETLEKPMHLDDLQGLYPLFISNLLKQGRIGWILVRKNKDCQILIGKRGAIEFSHGKIVRQVSSPFKNIAVDQQIVESLAQYATFQNNGDLVIYGALTSDGKLTAFEEHRGTHGGFYGDMNFPFIITNIKRVQNQIEKDNHMKPVFQSIRDTYEGK